MGRLARRGQAGRGRLRRIDRLRRWVTVKTTPMRTMTRATTREMTQGSGERGFGRRAGAERPGSEDGGVLMTDTGYSGWAGAGSG